MKKKWISDGCTMFPDDILTAAGRLCCCYHDKGFVVGGDFLDRWWNDLDFYYCLKAAAKEFYFHSKLEKQNFKRSLRAYWLQSLAPVMWLGVRFGGLPLWYWRRR